MQTLIIYAAKAMVYSSIFFGYYCLALRNKRFHYYNRFYLLMTVALSLLLPFFHFEWWQFKTNAAPVVQLMNVAQSNEGETIITSKGFGFNWFYFASFFYSLVALCLLLAAAFSVVSIFRFKRKYEVQKIENINFINTDLEQAPFSFFNNLFWKNTVSFTDDWGKQIFTHELTHIEQKHSWDKLFMRIITSVFWFNPAYWLMQKELALIHEFIADEKAIENRSAEAFALMILQSKYAKNIFSPAQSFYYSPIKRRLLMLTTSSRTSFSYARRMMVLPLLAISFILFAFQLKKDKPHTTNLHANAPFVLVVDAGHGGTDNGAEWDNVLEKTINLSISKKVEELAPAYGITVKMTRSSDETVSLPNRVNFTVDHVDAFVSLHVNATEEKATHKNGMEVYITRFDNNTNFTRSKLLGSSIIKTLQSNFITNTSLLQQKEKGIYVIDANPYPAILVECGYLNNKNDLKQLTDNAKAEQLARDILEGVVAFANADKKEENALQSASDTSKKPMPFNITMTAKNVIFEPTNTTNKPTPLYIVEGKEMSENNALQIDNNTFGVVNFLSKEESINQYGGKGKNGVVTIQFKKDSTQQPVLYFSSTETTNDEVDKTIDTNTVQFSSFPGGKEAWIKYLQQNLRTDILTKKKAPVGFYKVAVSFTVANDGTVSNVKAGNDPGFGTGAEAVRVIQQGPKWIPAKQNGKNITTNTIQAITFQVEESKP